MPEQTIYNHYINQALMVRHDNITGFIIVFFSVINFKLPKRIDPDILSPPKAGKQMQQPEIFIPPKAKKPQHTQ